MSVIFSVPLQSIQHKAFIRFSSTTVVVQTVETQASFLSGCWWHFKLIRKNPHWFLERCNFGVGREAFGNWEQYNRRQDAERILSRPIDVEGNMVVSFHWVRLISLGPGLVCIWYFCISCSFALAKGLFKSSVPYSLALAYSTKVKSLIVLLTCFMHDTERTWLPWLIFICNNNFAGIMILNECCKIT